MIIVVSVIYPYGYLIWDLLLLLLRKDLWPVYLWLQKLKLHGKTFKLNHSQGGSLQSLIKFALDKKYQLLFW